MKEKCDNKSLLKNLPIYFHEFLEHIGKLQYYDKPNYHLLNQCFEKSINDLNIKPTDPFDWELIVDQRKDQSTTQPSTPQQQLLHNSGKLIGNNLNQQRIRQRPHTQHLQQINLNSPPFAQLQKSSTAAVADNEMVTSDSRKSTNLLNYNQDVFEKKDLMMKNRLINNFTVQQQQQQQQKKMVRYNLIKIKIRSIE